MPYYYSLTKPPDAKGSFQTDAECVRHAIAMEGLNPGDVLYLFQQIKIRKPKKDASRMRRTNDRITRAHRKQKPS